MIVFCVCYGTFTYNHLLFRTFRLSIVLPLPVLRLPLSCHYVTAVPFVAFVKLIFLSGGGGWNLVSDLVRLRNV